MKPRKLVLTEKVGSTYVNEGEVWTNGEMFPLITASAAYKLDEGDIHWELLPQEEDVSEKKVMIAEDGKEVKRVKSGKIKPGRYYTDENTPVPSLWVLDEMLMGEDATVWKVKK